jgi:hypothetical protein
VCYSAGLNASGASIDFLASFDCALITDSSGFLGNFDGHDGVHLAAATQLQTVNLQWKTKTS